MPLRRLSVNDFWKGRSQVRAENLCLSVFYQARSILFYEKWNVPDTLEGRFDCACLHLALLLKHLKGPLAQKVFDFFFSYMELTLREEGVSDLRVGKQVKKCAKFFFGASKAYSEALSFQASLEEALVRNLYGGKNPGTLEGLIAYVQKCDRLLASHNFEKDQVLSWPKLD